MFIYRLLLNKQYEQYNSDSCLVFDYVHIINFLLLLLIIINQTSKKIFVLC